MSGFFYYLLTFAESITSVFGIREVYEQPRYSVIQDLGQNAEIRCYEPRVAIEVTIDNSDRQQAAGQAFNLLFRYITGANQASEKIAMTAPVSTDTTPKRIAMTVPVQSLARSWNTARRSPPIHACTLCGFLNPRLPRCATPASTTSVCTMKRQRGS